MFGWSKRNVKAKEPKPWKHEFQGLELDVWMYLGYTELQLDNKPYIIHMFCQHEDHSKREVRIQGTDRAVELIEDYHTYYQRYTQPWSMGDGEIYFYVNHPSKFLKQYMIEKYAHEWDKESQWWIPSDSAKYKSAQSKQTKTQKKEAPKTTVDENVVKVDFTRGNNEG